MEVGRTSPELLAKYRGEVSFTDAAFGDLISWMRERGSLDDTLVVLTADHGEEFAEHGNKGHGKTLYEEVVAVPLILRHPGSFESGRHTENVDLMDLGATLAAVGGARPPDQWTGRDLRGALTPAPVFSTSLLRDGAPVQGADTGHTQADRERGDAHDRALRSPPRSRGAPPAGPGSLPRAGHGSRHRAPGGSRAERHPARADDRVRGESGRG